MEKPGKHYLNQVIQFDITECCVADTYLLIESLEEIYRLSLPIKESEITDFFLKVFLKEEILKSIPVQKQIYTGQQTRFKAFITIGNYNNMGTGIVSAPLPKKLQLMASINDCYISSRGCSATMDNFTKSIFHAISKTYRYLIPSSGKRLCSLSLPIRNSLTIL
ncbi:hypothetical protein J1605_000218 [Eschrichtius robustus]|uniref:S5 DRBM domain-containing protein n=1 Tax=Eschrichtius robustus TaxID=9764 RepID=A0AB34HM06_ESCRO|nr:hypothetical protein J1605_000218 [Eschrichtius robustus]